MTKLEKALSGKSLPEIYRLLEDGEYVENINFFEESIQRIEIETEKDFEDLNQDLVNCESNLSKQFNSLLEKFTSYFGFEKDVYGYHSGKYRIRINSDYVGDKEFNELYSGIITQMHDILSENEPQNIDWFNGYRAEFENKTSSLKSDYNNSLKNYNEISISLEAVNANLSFMGGRKEQLPKILSDKNSVNLIRASTKDSSDEVGSFRGIEKTLRTQRDKSGSKDRVWTIAGGRANVLRSNPQYVGGRPREGSGYEK